MTHFFNFPHAHDVYLQANCVSYSRHYKVLASIIISDRDISIHFFYLFTLKGYSSFRRNIVGMWTFMLMKTATASLPLKHGVSLLTSNGPALLISQKPHNLTVILNLDCGWNGKGGIYFFCPWFLQLCCKMSIQQDCCYFMLGSFPLRLKSTADCLVFPIPRASIPSCFALFPLTFKKRHSSCFCPIFHLQEVVILLLKWIPAGCQHNHVILRGEKMPYLQFWFKAISWKHNKISHQWH